jgi:Ca-activated chloride channel family protein
MLFGASIALLFIALAGPQAGYRWEQMKRRGNDIIFAVDTSRSMLTPDVKPNRLERAKLAIDDFVNRLNGDAIGLVAFAGSAFLQTPITLDYGAFHESLAALDTHIIPQGGTNITSAIHEAEAALQRRPGSDKILILVTDGEDLEGDALAAAKAAAKEGLKIFTVGVGSANGDLIPLPADQGGGFLKDNEGHLVKSQLDESALKALAAATGGSHAPLGAENQGLDTIYQKALAPLAKHDLESRAQKVYIQRFQWPLGAALALLLGSLMIGTRRRARRSPAHQLPAPRDNRRSFTRLAGSSGALLGLCWLLPSPHAHASTSSAAKAYRQGDFQAAERDYSAAAAHRPQQPILQFDTGTAAYKAGEFPEAARAFEASLNAQASGSARRLADQEDTYYDLANTLYREGQKTAQTNPQETIQTWTHAIKTYDAALQLRPDDADSKFNRDLVNRKLEALKKAQSQQKQSSQSHQPKPQQGQGKQSNDNSSPSTGQQQASQPKQQSGGQSSTGQPRPGQPNEQPRQANGQPPPSKPTPAAMPSSGQSGQMSQAGDDRRSPGDMSRQEARELLDSVKNEERRAPAEPVARNGASDTPSPDSLKDW